MAKRQSAVHRRKNVTAPMVERELAVLVAKELAVDVHPGKLAQFIRDHFHLLSVLCHEIYELGKEPHNEAAEQWACNTAERIVREAREFYIYGDLREMEKAYVRLIAKALTGEARI